MKRFLPASFLLLLFLFVIFSWFSRQGRPRYSAHLAMQSDAMAIVNYYVPKRIELHDVPLEENLVLPTFRFGAPKFGGLIVGNSSDSLLSVVLDEGKGTSLLYIDKNNNEDLTDDGEADWTEEKDQYWAKEELLDVHYRDEGERAAVPYPIQFYRYKNRQPDALVAFRNGYREGRVVLADNASFKIALLDDDLDGLFNDLDEGTLLIDLNGDDILAGETDSNELFSLAAPFPVADLSYRVESVSPQGDAITFVLADTVISQRNKLTVGSPAPLFRAHTIDGRLTDLIFQGNRVVLIDFWATWCAPWKEQLSYLQRNYRIYHEQGFEIIGISLDSKLATLQEFLTTHDIKWAQVCTGQGWDMPLVQAYGIEAVPKNFLVDKNGVVRYKDLHGPSLGAKVRELLNEPGGETN